MAHIYVVGSINMDVVARVARHPQPGETIFGDQLHFIPGGKGSNQAVAAARLGGQVSLVGRLGHDAFGEQLLAFLRAEPLNTGLINRTDAAPTGTALIAVSASSENTIIVIPGSNALVSLEDVSALPFQAGDLVVCPFEIPQETIRRCYQLAHEAGASTILNPAPYAPMLADLHSLVDVLIVNETELAAYAQAPVAETDEGLRAQASQLATSPRQLVIITLGARGALAVRGDEHWLIAGQKVEAVDTTGAGDCFTGALAVALGEGLDIPQALQFANRAASLSVQRLGASASLPYRHELESF